MVSGEALQSLQEELENVKYELSEFQCPHCQASLTERTPIPVDPDNYVGELGEIFECGYTTIDGATVRPCPKSPEFPPLEEFSFVTTHSPDEQNNFYVVALEPQTKRARFLRFDRERGSTEEEAREKLVRRYEVSAGKRKA